MSMMMLHRSPYKRGRATELSFTTQPVAVVSGATMTAFVVKALRPNGEVAQKFTGNITVALTSSGGGALALGGTVTVAAVAGVATFSAVVPSLSNKPTGISGDPVAGYEFTLVATATGLTSATSNLFDVTWSPQVLTSAGAAINLSSTDDETLTAGKCAIIVNTGGTVAGDEIAFTDENDDPLVTLTCVASGAGDDQWDETTNVTTSAERIAAAINSSPTLSPLMSATNSGSVVIITRLTALVDNGIGVTENTANCTFITSASGYGATYNAVLGRFGTGIVSKTDAGGNTWTTTDADKRPLLQVTSGTPWWTGHTTSSSEANFNAPSTSLETSNTQDAGTVVALVKPQGSSGSFASAISRRPSNRGWRLDFAPLAGKLKFELLGATTVLTKESSNSDFPAGSWALAIVTYDGSRDPDGVNIYKNGSTTPLTPTSTTDTLTDDHASGTVVTAAGGNPGSGDDLGLAHVARLPGVLSEGVRTLYYAWAKAEFSGLGLP